MDAAAKAQKMKELLAKRAQKKGEEAGSGSEPAEAPPAAADDKSSKMKEMMARRLAAKKGGEVKKEEEPVAAEPVEVAAPTENPDSASDKQSKTKEALKVSRIPISILLFRFVSIFF